MVFESKLLRHFLSRCRFTLLVIAIILSFTGCNQQSDKATETTTSDSTTLTQAPVIDTAQIRADWDKFKAGANDRLKQSNDSIAAFKLRVKKFDVKMKARYERDVAMLERKDDTLKMKLENYKYESKEKWEDFKMGCNHDMDEVKDWLKDSTMVRQ